MDRPPVYQLCRQAHRWVSESGLDIEMGFKAKDAQKIVLQTIKGAVELLQETGEHPEAAIDKVTTPGGCTIKGLNTMEQGGFTLPEILLTRVFGFAFVKDNTFPAHFSL